MPTKRSIECSRCGHVTRIYRNPVPTVDIVIEYGDGIVLVKRKNFPFGWALPGGFIDYGEDAESAALREAREETGLTCAVRALLGVYSDPKRDPRSHTISTVYIARGSGTLRAADDAADACVFVPGDFPAEMAFDHARILNDYLALQQTER